VLGDVGSAFPKLPSATVEVTFSPGACVSVASASVCMVGGGTGAVEVNARHSSSASQTPVSPSAVTQLVPTGSLPVSEASIWH
jgi:hypothetical protein